MDVTCDDHGTFIDATKCTVGKPQRRAAYVLEQPSRDRGFVDLFSVVVVYGREFLSRTGTLCGSCENLLTVVVVLVASHF